MSYIIMKQQIQYNDVSERQKSYVVAKRKPLAVLIFNLFIFRTHYAYNYYFQLNYKYTTTSTIKI